MTGTSVGLCREHSAQGHSKAGECWVGRGAVLVFSVLGQCAWNEKVNLLRR